ncbi:hypothetical protein [Bacillus cereus group sp. BfR-BA-01317]|uniref:hypothetical protein n=1 Tax=unclassified Bacillus cereus group TaxID=2750818 RepID=UPI001F596F8D|nr:hypothetical protein [Bacillus cereus group sp. BfR-BA-01317]
MKWMYKSLGDKNPIWDSNKYETKEEAIEAAREVYWDELSRYTYVYTEYHIGQYNPKSDSIENVEKVNVSEL